MGPPPGKPPNISAFVLKHILGTMCLHESGQKSPRQGGGLVTPTAPHHAAGSTSRAVGPLGSNPGHAHWEGTLETEPLAILSLNSRRGTEGEPHHRDPRTHFQEWWHHRHRPVAKLMVCWLGAQTLKGMEGTCPQPARRGSLSRAESGTAGDVVGREGGARLPSARGGRMQDKGPPRVQRPVGWSHAPVPRAAYEPPAEGLTSERREPVGLAHSRGALRPGECSEASLG